MHPPEVVLTLQNEGDENSDAYLFKQDGVVLTLQNEGDENKFKKIGNKREVVLTLQNEGDENLVLPTRCFKRKNNRFSIAKRIFTDK